MRKLADIERMPPHDIDAEKAFLASLFLCDERATLRTYRSLLTREAFYQPDHQIIFDAIAGLIDAGKPLDALTIKQALNDRGVLDEVGGMAYLNHLAESHFSHRYAEQYATNLLDKAARRQAIEAAYGLLDRLYMPADEEKATGIIQQAVTQLWKASQGRSRVKLFSMEEMLHKWFEEREIGNATAQLTGIPPIDRFAGIFAFGKYTIIAGRPSMGKSTLVRWLLGEWAKQGMPVGLVMVEEDRSKAAGNYLASEAEIENDHLSYGKLTEHDWKRIGGALGRLSKVPWYATDQAFSLSEVATAVEMLVTEKGAKVVAVDHIHLIKPDKEGENEQREIKEISRRLKELAKEHNIVLIAAAQLSRPSTKVGIPPPPSLTDLRASGAIEEHADAALFIHREDYYRPREQPTREAEIIVAKNRNGKRGGCVLTAELEYQRFAFAQDPF